MEIKPTCYQLKATSHSEDARSNRGWARSLNPSWRYPVDQRANRSGPKTPTFHGEFEQLNVFRLWTGTRFKESLCDLHPALDDFR